MKYEYTNAFIKDVKKSSPEIQLQVRDLVGEIRKAGRLGEYRVGIFLENDTVILARILHRKEVYRYFP